MRVSAPSFFWLAHMSTLYLDIETRSTRSLHLSGAWAYADDDTTEVLCLCYAVDDGPVETWLPGQPLPSVFSTIAANLAD